jgi:Zn-dependent peptidase ImmA (M78 family)
MHKGLDELEINEVKKQAQEKLGVCRKINDIIGTQIFSILGRYARVIYYPLGKNAPWGFTRISGSRDDASLEKPFVAINTSIPTSCQVFAAAHELYHIWYERKPDMLPGDLLDEENKEINEKKANRFAAEFLVDDIMLAQEVHLYKITEINTKAILYLSELFSVPYKAMVKRLFETGYIGINERERFLAETDEAVEIYKKKYALPIGEADNRISVDNLAELSANAYEAGLITFEKLEYLLDICGLQPADLGLNNTTVSTFPSDEESTAHHRLAAEHRS